MGEFQVSSNNTAFLQVMHHSNIAGRRNKSNTHNYPSDDSEIVADNWLIPAKANQVAYHGVIMAGLGLKSAQRRRLHRCKQTAMHRQGDFMMDANQELMFPKFGTDSTLLFKLP
jgi:hypothetical protein